MVESEFFHAFSYRAQNFLFSPKRTFVGWCLNLFLEIITSLDKNLCNLHFFIKMIRFGAQNRVFLGTILVAQMNFSRTRPPQAKMFLRSPQEFAPTPSLPRKKILGRLSSVYFFVAKSECFGMLFLRVVNSSVKNQ